MMFYGWRIVGGSFVSQALIIGFFTYSVSLLTQPVQETFGVSVEEVMYSLTLGTFLSLFAMPLAGSLIDRFSLRKVMVIGLVLFAAGLALIANTRTITQYIFAFGFTMTIANSFAGGLVCSTVVSRWFTVNRGKALGVSAIGNSAGGKAPYRGVRNYLTTDKHFFLIARARVDVKPPLFVFFEQGGFLIFSLTMTYFHEGGPHYHRRVCVSRSCSGWEGVVPQSYGRQTLTFIQCFESLDLEEVCVV